MNKLTNMKDKLAELAHVTHIMTPEIKELAKQINEQEQFLLMSFWGHILGPRKIRLDII